MSAYKSFATTTIGSSHKKHGKECQDRCIYKTDPDMSIVAIADGHGSESCFRSGKGAHRAVRCASNGMRDFVKYLNGEDISKEQTERCLRERLIRDGIIRAWYRMVEDDFTKFPFTEEELKDVDEKYRSRYLKSESLHHAYGTTLIAAAITNDFWFGIHIGDGRLTALYPDGTFDQPVPWDEKCFLNRTTSICDDDAFERSRSYFSFHDEKQPPVAIFLCSDGVDDNYPVEDNEKHLFNIYRTIALTFAEDGFESTCEQLNALANQFATKGKGDDTSIAVLIDMEKLNEAAPIWRRQIAEETSTVSTAGKEAREKTVAKENAVNNTDIVTT